MNNLINKYNEFIANPKPSLIWQVLRFVLHWLTLPIKVTGIGFWSLLMHIYMAVMWRKRAVPDKTPVHIKEYFFQATFGKLPVFRNGYVELYVNRVPIENEPDGKNHNNDHQAARHGVYHFIMNKLGRVSKELRNATRLHLQKKFGVCRGYRYNSSGELEFNGVDTSGDQLLGLLLAIQDESDEIIQEEYGFAIADIINNDYALLHEDGKRKSLRGMWQPGLETVGAQAMTILAALKVGEKFGVREAQKHYKRLFWLYGYGILSLFPTTFAPINRGYFNDNNCLTAAYILAKNTKGLEKWYWTFVAYFVWSLSYKWYNPYFTGLLLDLNPKLVSKKYVEDTKGYLYESLPTTYSRDYAKETETKKYPVLFNQMNQGEFWCDEPHVPIIPGTEVAKLRSGLGWIAGAVMIDQEETKGFLK